MDEQLDQPESSRCDSFDHLADGWNPLPQMPGESRALTDEYELPLGLEQVTPPTQVRDPFGPQPTCSADLGFSVSDPHELPRTLDQIPPGPGQGEPAREGGRRRSRPVFPKLGQEIGGFRLLSELGQGAFGRVYLAEQLALADRPVALKVTESSGEEAQNLARLQHTNIVPINSVHDDPHSGLRLICMPYLGGANLAEILAQAHGRPCSAATGLSLIEALDRIGRTSSLRFASAGTSLDGPPEAGERACPSGQAPSGPTPDGGSGAVHQARRGEGPYAVTRGLGSLRGARTTWTQYLMRLPWFGRIQEATGEPGLDEGEPARRYFRTATYEQAAIWIAARLAEALDHAHQRGILHRDLKPSNILIAADGTPMLLDFNLAAPTAATEPEGATRARLGGTLPYMAPEHLDAFDPMGSTPAAAVGEQADLYALGLILFEMVAGQHPFSDPPAASRLTDTLRLMIEERRKGAPSIRDFNPQASRSLESVLSLCLAPTPSRRYRRAADLAEDLRRLLDDRPLKFAPEPSLTERVAKWARRNPRASSASVIGLVAAGLMLACGAILYATTDYLAEAQAQIQRRRFAERFSQCQLLLNTTLGPGDALDRGIVLAEEALMAYDALPGRPWAKSPGLLRLPANERRSLREEISELIQLQARASVELASRRPAPPGRRMRALESAVARLDLAEQIDPEPPSSLFEDRSRYQRALGRDEAAARDLALAAARPPDGARELTVLGTSYLARGEADRAEAMLARAVSVDPRRFWSWFALGLCHLEQGRHADAAGDFAGCTILAPHFAWPHVNRGLALARAGRLIEARAAYDRALEEDPELAEARINRALVCLELGDAETAREDLDRAIRAGRHEPAVLAARAEALGRLGRRTEAERGFTEALKASPDDPVVLVARGFFRLGNDAAGARRDFTRVLRRDPADSRAHLGMAYLLRATDPGRALEHLDVALESDPGFGDARQLRALIRGRLGHDGTEQDVDALASEPTPHRLYNAACAMALYARARGGDGSAAGRALGLLHRAVQAGFPRARAADDADLAALRGHAEFRALVAGGNATN